MKKLLLILNPCAGRRKANEHLEEIQDIFTQAGYEVTLHITQGPGDAVEILGTLGQTMDLVVCCGGDGTFNETVNGLMRHGLQIPVGYIACGSTNDFAASLQLPKNILDAARAIAQGQPASHDIGHADDRYFSYVASFGAFTRSSYATSQKAKNALGFFAYFCSGVIEAFRIRSIPIQVKTEEETIDGPFLFGAVSNSTRMGRVLKLDPKQVNFSDGKLEMVLIRPPKNPFELIRCIWQLKKRRYDHRMIVFRQVESVHFSCPDGTVWTLDGERYDAPEVLHISAQHQAISLIRKG